MTSKDPFCVYAWDLKIYIIEGGGRVIPSELRILNFWIYPRSLLELNYIMLTLIFYNFLESNCTCEQEIARNGTVSQIFLTLFYMSLTTVNLVIQNQKMS